MKYFWIFGFLLFSTVAFAQVQKKVIVHNALNHKPLRDIYCYILKNNDEWIDIGQTDKKGVFKTHSFIPDRGASYQVEIKADGFKPYRRNFNPYAGNKVIANLEPDSGKSKKQENLVYLECSSICFGYYYPKEPESINDLPDSIRKKLEDHLINRVGRLFYSRLKLTGGQLVDLDRLYIVEKNAINYRWIPYSYYLCFSFEDTARGIGLYSAKIVLDKNGEVKEEIDLPEIQKYPEKATLISLNQAKKIATANKYSVEHCTIKLSYDSGSITWEFETWPPELHDHQYSTETLVIDAHNGKILRTYSTGGIYDIY